MKQKSKVRIFISDGTSFKLAIVSMIMAIAVFFLSLSGTSAQDEKANKANIENTRTALEKWVDTQRTISKEKHDLALAKEMLNERINLVQREIDSLREKIKDAEKSIAEADKKRADLIEDNDKLKKASSSLKTKLSTLEDRTQQLLQRVPQTVIDRVKPLSQRLPSNPQTTQNKNGNENKQEAADPDNPEASKEADESEQTNQETNENQTSDKPELTLSERFQNVVGILNEFNKFHREITVTSEVRTLTHEKSAEVTAFYIGFGHAYYMGSEGNLAGIGSVSDEGWTWRQADEAASKIDQAIAIYNNEQVATFVQLPVQIQ